MTQGHKSGSGGRTRWWRVLLAVAAVAAPAAIYGFFPWRFFTPANMAVRHRLAEADGSAAAAMDARLQPLRDLFARGRAGVPAFAEEAVGWGGKWEFVKGLVKDGSHPAYLHEAFERHVFTAAELRAALEGACRAYAADLDAVEAEMLVRLRADLPDAEGSAAGADHRGGRAAAAREQKALAGDVAGAAAADLAVGIGRVAVSTVGGNIAAQAAAQAARGAAVELGVSGGILATGAGSFLATAGVGIVVGAVIDYILDELFKLFGYDAGSKVERAARACIDRTEAALLREASSGGWFGSPQPAGALRAELEKIRAERAARRRAAAELFLKGGVK